MPAFMAAAYPTFSSSARSLTRPPKPRATSRDPSVDALSTRTVSQATPCCTTADRSATARSGPLSFDTTTIETSTGMAEQAHAEHREVRLRGLAAGARHVAPKRERRQAQRHPGREQAAVRGPGREAVVLAPVAQGVAIEERQKSPVAQVRCGAAAAVPHARCGQIQDRALGGEPRAEIDVLEPRRHVALVEAAD